MNTTDIMNVALELSGFNDVPADSEIFHHGEGIRRVLFGIDINDADFVKAKELGLDLVISHHAPNRAWGERFTEVIERQIDFMVSAGVSPEIAQEAIVPIKQRFEADRSAIRDHTFSLAQEFDMPLMNIHQPCDEIGRRVLQSAVDRLGEDRLTAELVNRYNEIPEIKQGESTVELVCGDLNSKIGKGIVIHGAGTNGGYSVATALFNCGVSTVVYIHLLSGEQADREKLVGENRGNLIVTGHYPSDALGINPLIRELERLGLKVMRCNGL